MSAEQLITKHLDIWTSAHKTRSSAGRGSSNKLDLYGIKKLRELNLELAVRGKLVPQDPNDEPASELLKKLAISKVNLTIKGRLKQNGSPLAVEENDKPYTLPNSWVWVRFPQVCSFKTGKTPDTKNSGYWVDSGIPWVSIADMEHYGTVTSTSKCISAEASEKVFGNQIVKAGSIIMSFKLTVGKIAKLGIDAYHNEAIIAIQPFEVVLQDFIFRFLPSRAQVGNTKKAIMGNTLNSESLSLLLIPLPPIAEQQRIVEKVDELMAFCDELEQAQTDHIAAHAQLVEALLTTLTNSKDHQELQANWQRIAVHFDTLFTTEVSIDQLKQTILQLAVMGKLVPQDPNDEPASELLKKIAAEKAQLIKEGKIKKENPLPEIKDEEKPFDLPDGWSWSRLISIGTDLGGGTPSKSNPEFWNGDIPWVSPKDMKLDYIFDAIDNISENAIANSAVKIIPENSLLIVVRGMILAHSFPVAVNRVPVTINQDMKALVVSHIMPEFLLTIMKGMKIEFIKLVEHSSHGTCKIVSEKLWNLVIAIPSINEQKKIVSKIENLMTICDSLKGKIITMQDWRLDLSDVLVDKLLRRDE